MPINVTYGSISQIDALNSALFYLNQIPDFRDTLQSLNVNLSFISNGADVYSPDINTIFWDANSGLKTIGPNGELGVQSAALGLYHEIIHAVRVTQSALWDEGWATLQETYAAQILGEPIRATYYSHTGGVHLSTSTQHTDGSTWKSLDPYGNPLSGTPYVPGQTPPDMTVTEPSGGGGDSGGGGSYGGGSGSSGGGGFGAPTIPPDPDVYPIPMSTSPYPSSDTEQLMTGPDDLVSLVGVQGIHDILV